MATIAEVNEAADVTKDPKKEALVGALFTLVLDRVYQQSISVAERGAGLDKPLDGDQAIKAHQLLTKTATKYRGAVESWRSAADETPDQAAPLTSRTYQVGLVFGHAYHTVIEDIIEGKIPAPADSAIAEIQALKKADEAVFLHPDTNGHASLWHYVLKHQHEVNTNIADVYDRIAKDIETKAAGVESRFGIKAADQIAWEKESKQAHDDWAREHPPTSTVSGQNNLAVGAGQFSVVTK